MPAGPVQNMPITRPSSATSTHMSATAPRLGTRASTYIHTMPAGMAPTAWVNHAVFAFSENTIENAMNTANRSTPNTATTT